MYIPIRTISPSIVFIGAHMEAYAPFRRLIERGDNVLGLVTLDADSMVKVAGATDLTQLADQAQIPTLRVRNINQADSIAWISQKAPDLLLVVGWVQLLKPELLRIPKLACLGFHASLLTKTTAKPSIKKWAKPKWKCWRRFYR